MTKDLLRAALTEPWPGETGGEPQLTGLAAGVARARRRRTARRTVTVLLAAAALTVTGVELATGRAGAGATNRISPATVAPSVTPAGPAGTGQAALVTPAGTLELVPLQGGPPLVVEHGRPPSSIGDVGVISEPQFSPDGRELAWQVGQASGFSAVVEAPVAHPHRSHTLATGMVAAAWSPVSDTLAVLSLDRLQLFEPGAGRGARASWPVDDGSALAFSPGGTRIAVGARHGTIYLFPGRGGAATTLHSFPASDCAEIAGWTADGSRVLAWDDLQCSDSIGADGLTLDAVPVAGGGVVPLGETLPYPSWVVPVSGSTLVLDRGGDRVEPDRKRLLRCNADTGSCVALSTPPGQSQLDPALDTELTGCVGAHRSCPSYLLWTMVRSSTQPVDDNVGLVPAGLWLGNTSGAGTALVTAGTDIADPQPDLANGQDVLFLRTARSGTSATLVRYDVTTHRGTKLAETAATDYYGHLIAGADLATFGVSRTAPGPRLPVVARVFSLR